METSTIPTPINFTALAGAGNVVLTPEMLSQIVLQVENRVTANAAAAAARRRKKSIKGLTPITTLILNKECKKWAGRKLLWFKRNRKEQFDQGWDIFKWWWNGNKTVQILSAEEKTGKRIIVEIIHLLNIRQSIKKNYIYTPFLHVSGLRRKSCEDQLDEMREIGLYAEASSSKAMSQKIINDYMEIINQSFGCRTPLIMIDEADYASGNSQILEPFIKMSAGKLYISATNEEAIIGIKENNPGAKEWIFDPSPLFRGKKWAWDNGYIRKSEPFIHANREFTPHAKKIISDCFNNREYQRGRNIIKTRIPPTKKRYRKFKEMIKHSPKKSIIFNGEEIPIFCMFIDQESPFAFNQPDAWRGIPKEFVVLMFICEKAKRSTELAQPDTTRWESADPFDDCSAHSRLYASHDERKLARSNYATISQAAGRENHYHPVGHPIIQYMDEDVVKFKIGMIPIDNIKNLAGRLKPIRKKISDNVSWAMDFVEGATEGYGYETFEELKEWCLRQDPPRRPQRTAPNATGFYENKIRGSSSVHTTNDKTEIMRRGVGEHRQRTFRPWCLYNPNKDSNSLLWNATIRTPRADSDSSDEESVVVATTNKWDHKPKMGKNGSAYAGN